MRFDLLQSISVAGDATKANDDRLGCGNALAWVIDGATDLGAPGLLGTQGGAAWIAMEANAAFAAAGDGSVGSICKGLYARIARRYEALRTREAVARWEIPSAAFLVARIGPDGIEFGWMADCTAIIKRGDTVVEIGHHTAAKDAERDHAVQLSEHGLGLATRLAPIIDGLRQRRERPDRHVLTPDPAMADRVSLATIPVEPGDDVLLMTDGFSALVDGYAAISPADLVSSLPECGLAIRLAQLRAIERDDADCTRFPRFKISDDASAIWLRVVA